MFAGGECCASAPNCRICDVSLVLSLDAVRIFTAEMRGMVHRTGGVSMTSPLRLDVVASVALVRHLQIHQQFIQQFPRIKLNQAVGRTSRVVFYVSLTLRELGIVIPSN